MDSSNYKVSIITVVYNGASTIEQTIKSVLGQTYKNIEYIVIDGDSTDGTQQIIEKYLDNISYYISEKDEGLYYAMNKGIEKATGDIIGIINSDDWYDKNAVKNIVGCFRQRDVEIVYGQTIDVAENGVEKMGIVRPIQTIWYIIPFEHPSVFVKKSVYDRLGEFDTNYLIASDYDLLLRFYSENVKFMYVDKVIAYFRLGGVSTTCKSVTCKENYEISMKYIEKCAYKDEVIPKIEERYKNDNFYETISQPNGKLYELLCRYFNKDISQIIIFGTGIWGERCYHALAQTDIVIVCFSDNNVALWDTQFMGINVINPSELKNMSAYILIAVKYHSDEIKRQLNNMENVELKCVTIKELKEMTL